MIFRWHPSTENVKSNTRIDQVCCSRRPFITRLSTAWSSSSNTNCLPGQCTIQSNQTLAAFNPDRHISTKYSTIHDMHDDLNKRIVEFCFCTFMLYIDSMNKLLLVWAFLRNLNTLMYWVRIWEFSHRNLFFILKFIRIASVC